MSDGRTMHPTMLALQRVLAGMTQQRLADLSGVPEEHIDELEQGKTTARFITVMKLAKGLRIPEHRLLIQPIEPELFRQLIDREITYEEFRQRIYATPEHDHSCPGCGGLR